ncbi:TPA: hypothetical protein JBB10_01475 [Legionella pneumophila subsp. pneumophila]|nr:hypothetical protein [Legionella pneumophila subsp. pneumophila]HAU0776240.1 hypothetical protein [Legionella pneumophila]
MTSTLIVGNGLGMALNPDHFNLQTGLTSGAFRVRSCLLPLYSRITKVINHNGSKGQDLTLVPICSNDNI